MAGQTTYKDLYRLIREEIDKGKQYQDTKRFRNQLDRGALAPAFPNSVSDIRAADLITTIQNMLDRTLPQFIKTGLDVTQTDPVSSSIIITAGEASKGANLYELSEDVTLPMPFNPTTFVWYVNLFRDRIMIEKTERDNAVTLAKIIVPVPGSASKIYTKKADREDLLDAYIVSFKEFKLYKDVYDNLEEDSLELLRANIGPVLGDNIIGNIRLSENLKIINTQGTLTLNSDSMLLSNVDGLVLAKFNRNGTFYYDENGIELARFTSTDSRIGNILITKNSIQSADYISENKGFKITDSGFAEFDNVRVRGRISSSVFEQDKISSVGGKLFVGKSSVLAVPMSSSDSETLTVEDSSFTEGDILNIKEGVDEEYMEVTDASGAPTYVVDRDIAAQYPSNDNPEWQTGTAIVSTGNPNSGQTSGFILLDAVSSYSPFIDIAERSSSVYNSYEVRVRIGNLEGISDPNFHASGGSLSGYGLYGDNVYLKGQLAASTICSSSLCSSCIFSTTICSSCIVGTNCIVGATIKTAESGQRLMMDNSGLYAYNSSGVLVAKFRGDGICFVDPSCNQCYSYLDSGALKFHHPYGDIPYAKQIKSGTATAGATVYLCHWYCQPEVIVGIQSLRSYDCTQVAECQQWCVYYDNLQPYVGSGDDFGWSFDVHAALLLSGGGLPEEVHSADFSTNVVTNLNVTCALVKMNFQLFTHGAAPSNMCYGCLCYHLKWRPNGSADPYTCCSYTYEQPHSTCTAMKTTQTVCHTISFGSGDDWEIQAIQDGISWVDSGISSGAVTCNYWCCEIAGCTWLGCSFIGGTSCCCRCCNMTFTWPAAPVSTADIYCQRVVYGVSAGSQPFVCTAKSCGSSGGSIVAYYSDGENTYSSSVSMGASDNPKIVCNIPSLITKTWKANCYMDTMDVCICICRGGSLTISSCMQYTCACICGLYQELCYYTYSGTSDSCCLRKLYSTTETTTDSSVLDSSGVINWLAVAYA